MFSRDLLLAAVLACSALAAPTSSTKAASKLSFSVGVKSYRFARNPEQALSHAYEKFGWNKTKTHDLSPLSPISDPSSDPNVNSDLLIEEATNLVNGLLKLVTGPSSVSSSIELAATSSYVGSTTSIVYGSAPTSAPYQNSTVTFTATHAASTFTSSAATSANGAEVTATPEPNDSEYLSPVNIGGQQLTLDFDTGSADLWVFSTALSASAINGHTAFDPSKSPTFENYTGSTWAIHYGDGSYASGTAGFDTVTIGGASVTHQCVELANALSGSFEDDIQSDGLLGLGFTSINQVKPQKQQTWFENLMPSLSSPLFSVALEKDAAGTYEFGSIDSSKYVGDIQYTPVDNSMGFWAFDSSYYVVGEGTNVSHCATCNFVIADTGSSLMILDDDIVTAYYAQVPGAKETRNYGYVYPCKASLPAFSFQIGNTPYLAQIPGSEMTYAQLSSTQCMGGLQSNGNQAPQVLGDMFLKNFFVVFDGGELQFGVAKKA